MRPSSHETSASAASSCDRFLQRLQLRTIDGGGRPLFISEYGFGSANNLLHLRGHYAQAAVGYAFDQKALDEAFARFTNDWSRWRMADTFGNMENYFHPEGHEQEQPCCKRRDDGQGRRPAAYPATKREKSDGLQGHHS